MPESEHTDISSSLEDKPKIDNGVWIPFLKDGQKAQDQNGVIHILTREAIDAGYRSYLGGFVDVNHQDRIKGKIVDVKREGGFAYFMSEGLDERTLQIMNSPAYNGVSQYSQSLASEINPDKTVNVKNMIGKGVSIILYPKTPGCPLSAGCGIPIASEQKGFNFSLYSSKLTSNIKYTGGTKDKMTDFTKEQIAEMFSFLKGHPDMITGDMKGMMGTMIGSAIQTPGSQADFEVRVKEINAANLVMIKSALDARDAEYSEKERVKTERTGLLRELSSCVNTQTMEKLQGASTEVLKSNLELVKGLGVSMPGVGAGEEIRSSNLSGLKQFEAGREIYEKLGLTEKDFIGVGK